MTFERVARNLMLSSQSLINERLPTILEQEHPT